MIRLTVRQLEYVEALVQTRHFGRAAALAGVTQPALSAQLAEMERRLGCRLFDRRGRSVELTEDGRRLMPGIDAVLVGLREIEAAARSGQIEMEGRFRLGVIPTVAPYLLPLLLPVISERFPALKVELREAVTDMLVEEVLTGRLEAILTALPLDRPGLVSEPLFQDRFLLAVPVDDPDFVEPPVPPESPALERLMLLEEGHCMREQALAVCGKVRPAEMSNYGATSLTTLLHMVAHGQGVTLIPEMAVESSLAVPQIRIVPFAEPAPARMIGLTWRRNSGRRGECAALARLMRELRSGSGDEPDGKHRPQENHRDETGDEGRLAMADAVRGDVDRRVDDA